MVKYFITEDIVDHASGKMFFESPIRNYDPLNLQLKETIFCSQPLKKAKSYTHPNSLQLPDYQICPCLYVALKAIYTK